MPTSLMDLAGYVRQGFDQGKARADQSALGKLMSQGYGQGGDRSGVLGQIAQISPQAAVGAQHSFGAEDDAKMERVGQLAGMLVSLPPQSRPQAYLQVARELHSLGLGQGLPAQWDDSLLPYAQQIAGQIGGSGQGVQSTYVDAQGNRVAIMRDGSTQTLGQNAPQNQIIDTGNGFFGVNKGNLQAAPVMTGGRQGASGEVPFSIDPSLPPSVQASIRGNPDAGSAQGITSLGGGQQLRSVPKPMTPAEQANLGIAKQRLSIAQGAAADAATARNAAVQLKEQAAAEKRQKLEASRADTLDSYDQSIAGIDTLLKSPNFDTLGTFSGDAMSAIPHTGARDARSALDTVKNRVLLDTISKLKALSQTGASGFGSLSNQEGEILKNSIANLDKAQSHAAIEAALRGIRSVMQQSRDRIAGAQAGPPPAATSGVLRYNPATGDFE